MMNYRQKKAYANIYHASNWLLGGLENTLQDYDEGSEEYREAKAQLDDHEGLVETVYDMAIMEEILCEIAADEGIRELEVKVEMEKDMYKLLHFAMRGEEAKAIKAEMRKIA